MEFESCRITIHVIVPVNGQWSIYHDPDFIRKVSYSLVVHTPRFERGIGKQHELSDNLLKREIIDQSKHSSTIH